jgi:putative protein kinase ArgK-like GTPase of G3E family
VPTFVGRAKPLARLTTSYRALAGPGSVSPGRADLVLVTGEAGVGKTALLTRFTTEVAGHGGTVVWGTCWDGSRHHDGAALGARRGPHRRHPLRLRRGRPATRH